MFWLVFAIVIAVSALAAVYVAKAFGEAFDLFEAITAGRSYSKPISEPPQARELAPP